MLKKFFSCLKPLPMYLVFLSFFIYPVLGVASLALGGSRTERGADGYYLIGKDTRELPDGRLTPYKTRRKVSKAVYERAKFLYTLPSFGVMFIAGTLFFAWLMYNVFKIER